MTNTLDPELTLHDTFPPVTYDQWRALAEASLAGAPFEKKLVSRTYEGIDLQPVYTLQDRAGLADAEGMPGSFPFVRGTTPLGASVCGWDLRQEHDTPQPAKANEAILADLEGGVTSLLLVLDRAAQGGLDPDDPRAGNRVAVGGLMAYHLDDLAATLKEVHLSMIGVALDAGAAFLPAAAMLAALWRQQGLDLKKVRGAFQADPLAVLAGEGELPYPLATGLAQMADLAKWTAESAPQVKAVSVNTAPYHLAGATAAQDLACAMATGVEYLRAMTSAGMDLDTAAQQMLFRISLGTHHFLAIAKLRAGRRLWSRVIEAAGGSPQSAAMHVHARMAARVQTQRDPYVNLLRNTVAVFAAGVGGAEIVTSLPFDHTTDGSDLFSQRIARNTGLILQEEANLHKVIDPAGGSWFLDTLTDQVADKGWEIFQAIEREGGMAAALDKGWIAEQIDTAFAPRARAIATRKDGITGVSEFPDLKQEPLEHEPIDYAALRAAAAEQIQQRRQEVAALAGLATVESKTAAAVEAVSHGATLGQVFNALGLNGSITTTPPLPVHRFAEPYEHLRDASDAWLEEHGRRPSVFLVNLGPLAHHTARAMYANSFFQAGGFEVVTNAGFNDAQAAVAAYKEQGLKERGAKIAVLCSSDKLYPDFVPQVAPLLKEAGARSVVLAGRPGEQEQAWRAAGVDRFIYISCDVVATLRELLEEEGVVTA